jgi:hypothetical protein
VITIGEGLQSDKASACGRAALRLPALRRGAHRSRLRLWQTAQKQGNLLPLMTISAADDRAIHSEYICTKELVQECTQKRELFYEFRRRKNPN